MALINCPECGRQVSDKAAACPDCGYPIASAKAGGSVSIKINNNIIDARGFSGSVAASVAIVQVNDNRGQLLGEGKLGSVIRFRADNEVNVTIRLKHGVTMYSGPVRPNCRYELTRLPSLILSKFALNEIDVIDSGW